MNRSEFDRHFDAAFDSASRLSSAAPEPDYRPSWARMQEKLRSQRKSRRARTAISRLAILAFAVLIGAFLIDNTSTVRAIEPMYAQLVKSGDGMLSFFFGRDEDYRDASIAKTAPPPDAVVIDSTSGASSALRGVITDASGARKVLSFTAPDFGYMPEDLDLQSIEVFYEQGQEVADSAVYTYLNKSNGFIVHLYFKKLTGSTGTSANPGSEGITVEKVQLRDGSGVLTTSTDGTVQLETVSGNVQISFGGRMPADELLRIYEEMRL